ncbi:SH3 domain-containing protein [Pseudomonas citronellolis]|uniref:SH3 domain-containing protein n=1 Tax=Pseudomonas citronellolis TaxID=53408 RepID=UPI002D77384D|nr:SH3 domain-containing protein [Pseudomonas citronellolis]WRT85806.1 SH3 domain-containing protein [Pseudomonas citronellolis]
MEKQKKVERWSYPFKAKGSNGGASSEITDPQVYYDALAKAGSGFYPVSSNGLWHGGVHFDQNTGAQLDQSSVRCIADGEVIAYRIDGKYKTLTYGEGASAHETIYSTGFVLVRHRLELPPAPAPATPAAGGTQPAATPPAAEPDLTFYSLYMHLMDWQGYQDKPELERPAFWAGDARTVKQSAPDKLQGLRVRATPNGTVLGVLPRGTLVEAEAAGPGINPNWLKFIRATPAVAGLAENTGYLHKGPADGSVLKALGEGRYIVNHKAKDPIEPAQKGANIRSAANGNSPILGLLPAGTQVRVSPTATTKSYHKLLAITQGSATPAVSAEQLASEGYVWVKDLEAIKEPQARDSVFLVEPPVPIQAGALIGHLGKYQAATQGAPQDLLHLEVFTCDDMEAFVTQSRARAKQLKPEQKTLLKIPSETKLITREDATQENPPQVSDPGQPTAYDMILPLAVLEALPAERKITLTTTTGGTTTTERWWKLENMPGKDGQPIGGWVKEDELITPRLHPWDWEGFDFIKETSTLSDQYACKLSTDGVLDDGEKTNYQAQINQGDSGPIKERLYDIIDTNNDEKLTPEEIRNAIGKPWHAQSISRLIVQYESEWYADPGLSKWEALSCYMTKEGEKSWSQEKIRIKSFLWWSQLFSQVNDNKVWHISPTALLSSFIKPRCQCKAIVKVTRWNNKYGPVHWGTSRLSQAEQWSNLIASGQVTAEEKEIICVMTENEGKIEAVQSYDSEIITAGAMQKTVNPTGGGELPAQVKKFKDAHPGLYIEYFEERGWHLDTSDTIAKMYYQSPDWEDGTKLEGEQLKLSLRKDCNSSTFGKTINCLPVSTMSCAISTPEYITIQIMDFITRLKDAISIKPSGYAFTAKSLFRSKLGRALVLDEHINRPGNVANDLGSALDRFFTSHPNVSKEISTWGDDHSNYESTIIDDYGPSRNMTDSVGRFEKLKQEL